VSSFNGTEILEKLFKKGVHSIYLEGGSKTTSAFLNCSGLDQIQLHISPIILGSGVSNFTLPEIADISEGISFSEFMFVPVGDTVMFIGNQTSN
jgi:diaminohydroxyphosphoribosylaminopyrimidine deaminase/5-amino-6-(5-phosphoribosylamino)uracil reductase